MLALMAMEGLYTASGDWAYTVGLPAKSGVGGGLVAVSPGKMAIAAYSPPLNEAGNSVRAQAAITQIARTRPQAGAFQYASAGTDAQSLCVSPMVNTGLMTDADADRVAVYLDFDNIVISRYDQVNGRSSFQKDKAKGLNKHADRLERATVDVGAIIDFASSFGTLVLTRAYADWSAEVNTGYREQLVGRAVDLVQLFPAAAYGKNGADIRLAVDAVEDMFRLPDLTHVVIVAGDSDYIALAQRCKRLGRYVVGVGVAGSSSKALAAACDDFVIYDALPGVPVPEPAPKTRRAKSDEDDDEPQVAPDPQLAATALLTRALRIGTEKDDVDWQHNSAVKAQMKRMDPSFSEKSLGFSLSAISWRSRSDVVELDESSTTRMVRLRGTDA